MRQSGTERADGTSLGKNVFFKKKTGGADVRSADSREKLRAEREREEVR